MVIPRGIVSASTAQARGHGSDDLYSHCAYGQWSVMEPKWDQKSEVIRRSQLSTHGGYVQRDEIHKTLIFLLLFDFNLVLIKF